MELKQFFSDAFEKGKELVGDGVEKYINAQIEIDKAKQLAPIRAAELEQQNVLSTPDSEVQRAEVLSADEYRRAAHSAAGSLGGMPGWWRNLPTWAKVLGGVSAGVLVLGVTIKLVRG